MRVYNSFSRVSTFKILYSLILALRPNKAFVAFPDKSIEINVKKIAFGNKEHTTAQKMGVSVLLRLFLSSNEVCNTAYIL